MLLPSMWLLTLEMGIIGREMVTTVGIVLVSMAVDFGEVVDVVASLMLGTSSVGREETSMGLVWVEESETTMVVCA